MNQIEMLNLVTELEGYVIAHAPRFSLTDSPEAAFKPLSDTGRYIIWDGASEQTIFSNPLANYYFRAWHEAAHVMGELAFSFDEEYKVWEAHCRELYKAFDLRTARKLGLLLYEEVVLQAEEYQVTGAFPVDQKRFAIEKLGGIA